MFCLHWPLPAHALRHCQSQLVRLLFLHVRGQRFLLHVRQPLRLCAEYREHTVIRDTQQYYYRQTIINGTAGTVWKLL